jgi:hypothetical protein
MFKFTIRDVLWLTVLAAVLTLWGIDHWRQSAAIHKLDEIVGPLQGAGVNRYYGPPPAQNPSATP